jgi:chorismate synthase
MKIERDTGRIVAGVRLGETIGSPVAIAIPNRDHANWQVAMSVEPRPDAEEDELRRVLLPRPGHADLVGLLKYDRRDARDILERASARETSARVAAGAIARRLLGELEIGIGSHVVAIGSARADVQGEEISDLNRISDPSDVRCIDEEASDRMRAAIAKAASNGDTLGGVFEVVARGVPVGLGSHVSWDRRLDARIGAAMLSIQAMKGVEIGLGFEAAGLPGSLVHDEISVDPAQRRAGGFRRHRNSAGGLEGGMTTGEPLVVRVAMKPLSSLTRPLSSVDLATGETAEAVRERSDVCAVPAAAVVGEAMLAIVLADALLEKYGSDSMEELRTNFEAGLERMKTATPFRSP